MKFLKQHGYARIGKYQALQSLVNEYAEFEPALSIDEKIGKLRKIDLQISACCAFIYGKWRTG
jgi:hypothetical protein